jgi:16S rRNA (cytidine1402-2'-O)-methyltransferase
VTRLYIVATPIGNLSDITERALETLHQVDLIACEDTRRTLKLLNHYSIQKRLVSYHEFNEEAKAVELIGQIETGTKVGLVSDAGTPAISDPGYRIVRLCRERGVPVIPIPGPNAAIAALSASGIPSAEFLFAGFLPPKRAARRDKLGRLATESCTLIFYEAPHRITEMLADLQEVLGDREVCIARELTKIHEEYLFGKLSDVRTRVKPQGEFVVVVCGRAPEEPRSISIEGISRKDVLKLIAEKTGIPRKQLYDVLLKQ